MIFDRQIRKMVPSVSALSYNPVFAAVADGVSAMAGWIYPEWRSLPPNRLRVRVGVNNRIFFNQSHYLSFGANLWLNWLSTGYATRQSAIMEIGCGCGRVAWPLRGSWFKGRYVGIDIDAEMLDWCSKNFDHRFAFHRSSHASKTYRDTTNSESVRYRLPGADRSMDYIFSTSLLTHLLEFELINYAEESFRLIKPGGVVLMYFFSYQAVQKNGRWTFHHRMGNAYVENLRYPEAAVAYQADFMVQVFRNAGFTEISVHEAPVQSLLVCRR